MRKLNKILSLVLSVAMVIGLVPMMAISSSAVYSDKLTFDENGEFTIIQFSDIQDDKEVHEDTLEMITKALNRYKPDLMVMTGDNIAGSMSESDFKSSVNQFMAPVINAGVPYAITFGNHDAEDGTLVNTPSRDEQYNYYISLSDLAIDYDVDSLSHTGTGSIPIYSYDGSTVKFAVFPIDTGDYDENGDYDHAQTDQVQWYEAEANRLGVPHMVFQHIIVPEIYTTLLVKAESSTPGAVQGHGNWSGNYYVLDPSNTTITGTMREQPCPSAQNGGQYAAMVRTGTMVGNFVGHDHTNDFVGTSADGITIGYTQAMTMHSYGTHDPAVRVFHVKEDGTYTTEHIALSEMDMEAADDYEHDTIAGTPTVPSRLIVGAAGNGLTQQKLGNVIQQYSVNHKTQALYPNDMEITIDLASSVTGVTLTPQSGINVSGPTVTTADKDGLVSTYTWTITGGTATAGTAAEFKFDYTTADGTVLTQYAYSYVDDIATPAGYYMFTRNYRGGNNEDNWNSQQYVMTVLGDTAYGDARAQTDTSIYGYEGAEIGNWTNATAGYYNYTAAEDAGFVGMGDPNYGLIFTSPARANARAFYYFTRFTAAGKSPVSTIYVDTNEHTKIADLNLSVNYWRHQAPDHNLTTQFKLYFKLGDSGYTTSNLSENTAGTTQINSNISTITLAAARGSNNNFTLTGTLPADGTEYTLISEGYSYWNDSYDTPHYTYAPVLLRFALYNKGALKELVNAERTAMRQTDDIVYRAAFKEAYKQVMKVNTTQADIDAAVVLLNSAIESLTFDGTDVSNNGAYAGTTTIPPVIYIAGSGYGAGGQPTGTNIQSGVLNYVDGTLNTNYSRFSFSAPQGATGVSVSVTESNGNTVSYTWDAGTNSGQITGGTSAEGATIIYKFSYTLGGKLYEQMEGSAVLPAPQAAGWTQLVKMSGGLGAITRAIVETAVYFGDIGQLPAGFYYTGVAGGSSDRVGVNINGTSFGSQAGVAGVGMNRWDSGNDTDNDRMYGYSGDIWSNPGSDSGARAMLNMFIDTSVVNNLGATGMGIKFQSLQNAEPGGALNNDLNPITITKHGFYSGAANMSTVAADTDGNTTAIQLTNLWNPAGGEEVVGSAQYGHHSESGQDLYLVGTLQSGTGIPAAGTYTYWVELNENNSGGSEKLYTHSLWNLNVTHTNKAEIRNFVAQEEENFRQLADGYDNSDGSFTAFQTALAKAKAAITDVTLTDAETAQIQTNLNVAIQNLKYLPADYTKLRAKVLEVRIENAEGTGNNKYSYRPHPNNDPTYYATGEYYPWDCFSSTNEIDIPIKDIVWDYDCRYQNKVDMMVDAIDVGWINVRLVNADYTNVDKFLGYKSGTGENGAAGGANILAPNKYDYLKLTDPMLPAEYYTTASYNAWTDACAIGQSNRSLKKPDQPTVDGYATALETAYNNLTLLSADFTPLDDVEEVVQENINVTVEVVDPSSSANNYNIPYYSPEIIAQINEKLAERDAGLTIVEQDKVTALVAEIDVLYQQLSETLNDVDLTFANQQKDIQTTYEAEAEKYYTADSWARLVAARAAVSKYTNRQADSQVAVNAAAQEIYDALNALEYNEANYNTVNEYLALIAEAEPNKDWYTNWSAVDVAVAAVVTGLDVTEQDRVDKMAADLKTAYENLALKDASYANLKAAIDLASEKNKDAKHYTTATYNPFSEALAAAQALYTAGQTTPLKINEQAVLDNAEALLRETMGNLKYQDANIQPLVDAMTKYEQTVYDGMYNGEYPDADEDGAEDILNNVKSAYAAAQQWFAQYEAGELTVKDDASIALAANTLESLRAALPASYIPLYDALYDPYTGEPLYDYTTDGKLSAYVPTLEANLKAIYTDETVKAVIDALKAVNYGYTIDNQTSVDDAAAPVYETVALLEYRPADLTDLLNAITAGDDRVAQAESTDWFTPETWADYEDAYNTAVDVRDADPAYTALEQDVVDEATKALTDATAALDYVAADYDALNDAIATANDLNESDWTPESWADLEDAVALADTLAKDLKIDRQAEIDAVTEAIVTAIENLKSGVLELVGLEWTDMNTMETKQTIIDNERGFIYGLIDVDMGGEITDLVAQGYAEVVGNGYLKYTYVGDNSNLGTGAKVELIRGEDDGDDTNNEVVKTYYIVIFGDNDGDGYVTVDDCTKVTFFYGWDFDNAVYDFEDLTIPQVFAMDINADGFADIADLQFVVEHASFMRLDVGGIAQSYTGQPNIEY